MSVHVYYLERMPKNYRASQYIMKVFMVAFFIVLSLAVMFFNSKEIS